MDTPPVDPGEQQRTPPAPGIRLAQVMGVPVYLSPSWLLFAGVVVLVYGPQYARSDGQLAGYAAAAAYAVLLLVSVLLHELGHCVIARRLGLPVRSITVTLLAGMTDIAEPPQTPGREYAVAVAGPMVSLLLSAVGFACLPLLPDDTLIARVALGLAVINASIAVFNLLPGLPLDGGRVLRAVIWRVTGDPHGSTRTAAWAGRAVALFVPLLLIFLVPIVTRSPPDLLVVVVAGLVSSFIFLGASAALRQAEADRRLPGLTVAGLARPALGVPSHMPLAEALRRAREAGVGGLVVLDSNGRVEAVVSEASVVATPQPRQPWISVGALARRIDDSQLLDPDLAGEPLLAALRRNPTSEYVVGGSTDSLRVVVAADVAAAISGDRSR